MKRPYGFTLLEVALSIMLVSLVLYGFSSIYSKYILKTKKEITLDNLHKTKEVLLNFIKINGYVPCPDSASPIDGVEDRDSTGECHRRQGRLPWKTLGVAAEDGWGNYFYYRVINVAASNDARYKTRNPCQTASVFGKNGSPTIRYSNASSNTLLYCEDNGKFYCDLAPGDCSATTNISISDFKTLLTSLGLKYGPPFVTWFTPPVGIQDPIASSNLRVYDQNALGSTLGLAYNSNVIDDLVQVVVLSFGKNGKYVWNGATNGSIPLSNPTIGSDATNNCSALTSLDSIEVENCNGDQYFILDETGQSDDLMVWLDLYEIKASLLAGGGY